MSRVPEATTLPVWLIVRSTGHLHFRSILVDTCEQSDNGFERFEDCRRIVGCGGHVANLLRPSLGERFHSAERIDHRDRQCADLRIIAESPDGGGIAGKTFLAFPGLLSGAPALDRFSVTTTALGMAVTGVFKSAAKLCHSPWTRRTKHVAGSGFPACHNGARGRVCERIPENHLTSATSEKRLWGFSANLPRNVG